MSKEIIRVEGVPGIWGEKLYELRERELEVNQREAQLDDVEYLVRVLANDLLAALYSIRDHQNVIARLEAPNPLVSEANALLRKYNVAPGERSRAFAILEGMVDITDLGEIITMETIFDLFDVEGTATEDAGDLPVNTDIPLTAESGKLLDVGDHGEGGRAEAAGCKCSLCGSY